MAQSSPLLNRMEHEYQSSESGDEEYMVLKDAFRSCNSLLTVLRTCESFVSTSEGLLVKIREPFSDLEGSMINHLCKAIQELTNGNPGVFPVHKGYVTILASGVKWEILIHLLTAFGKIRVLQNNSCQAVSITIENPAAAEGMIKDFQMFGAVRFIKKRAEKQGVVVTLGLGKPLQKE